MKLIMENWKRWLKEQSQPLPTPHHELKSQCEIDDLILGKCYLITTFVKLRGGTPGQDLDNRMVGVLERMNGRFRRLEKINDLTPGSLSLENYNVERITGPGLANQCVIYRNDIKSLPPKLINAILAATSGGERRPVSANTLQDLNTLPRRGSKKPIKPSHDNNLSPPHSVHHRPDGTS